MAAAPLPPDEEARLAAIDEYGLLDAVPQPAFDDFTRLVAYICDVPTALVSVIDERRQVFLSRVGLELESTPREDAFCAHAILDRKVLVVPDAVQDPRFADNPLVQGAPRIRFYAGAPLVLPGGQAAGTLCAIDSRPRQLSDRQLRALESLARQLVTNIELRRVSARLARTQAELERDVDAAAVLQQTLIPSRRLRVPGVELGWRFEPARTLGGDLFNVVRLPDGLLGLYMLDVSGHGVPSAVVTFAIAQSLATIVALPAARQIPEGVWDRSPATVLGRLERAFPFERFEKFLTMACLVLDLRSAELRHASAAHPAPLLFGADGRLEELPEGGGLLGVGLGQEITEGRRVLRPGDRIFLYTDGLTDRSDDDGEGFGFRRLEAAIRASAGMPVDAACGHIVAAAHAHARGTPLEDDLTLLALEFRGGA